MARFVFKNKYNQEMQNNYFHRIAKVSSFTSFGGFSNELYVDPGIITSGSGYVAALSLPRTNVFSEFNAIHSMYTPQTIQDFYGLAYPQAYYYLQNPAFTSGVSVSIFGRRRGGTNEPLNIFPPYAVSTAYPRFAVRAFRGADEHRMFDAGRQNFGLKIISTYSKALDDASFINLAFHLPTFTIGTLKDNQMVIPTGGLFYRDQYAHPSTPGLWIIDTYSAVFQRRTDDTLTFRYRLMYRGSGTAEMPSPPKPTKLTVVIIEDRPVPDFRVLGAERYKVIT